jgi:hypothetical protein
MRYEINSVAIQNQASHLATNSTEAFSDRFLSRLEQRWSGYRPVTNVSYRDRKIGV